MWHVFSGIVLWPLGNMFYSQGRGQPAQDGIKQPQLLPSPPFPPALLPFGLLFYLVAQRSFFPSEKVIFQELEKTTPPNPATLTKIGKDVHLKLHGSGVGLTL